MCRFRIVVDLCDTLAQVAAAVEGIYGPMPDPLEYFHPAVNNEEYWADPGNRIAREIFRDAKPFPGAANLVTKLSQRYRVVYLTARPGWSEPVSKKWLALNGFPKAPIVCTQDKVSWVLKNNVIGAIEDQGRWAKEFKKIIPHVFIPIHPWNRDIGNFSWENPEGGFANEIA